MSDIRTTSLALANDYANSHTITSPAEVVARARAYEEYLLRTGAEPQATGVVLPDTFECAFSSDTLEVGDQDEDSTIRLLMKSANSGSLPLAVYLKPAEARQLAARILSAISAVAS